MAELPLAPTPAAHTNSTGRATLGGRLRPLGLDPSGNAITRPSTRSSRSAGRDRAAGAARQPRRRRITPNTNTSTTTMISTHNHVDMAASLVGPGQLKLTLLPPTRASNSVTARPAPGPGSTAAHARPLAGTPAPRDLPADLGWPGSRPRRPRWGPSPSGPRPASPAQPPPPAPHERRTGQASPTRRDHSDPDRRVWRGRAAFALLGWENNPSMAVPRRDSRRWPAAIAPVGRSHLSTPR